MIIIIIIALIIIIIAIIIIAIMISIIINTIVHCPLLETLEGTFKSGMARQDIIQFISTAYLIRRQGFTKSAHSV
jgi:hypothetical protein